MSAIGALEIKLAAREIVDYYKKVPPFLPIPYAYCLLDLTADDSKSPNKVFKSIPGFISEKISDEITWQLPCRTNALGYVVPIIEKNLDSNQKYQVYQKDPQACSLINRIYPLKVNFGTNFNLFWTYEKKLFDAARKSKEIVYKENQLNLCTVMFNSDEYKTFYQVLIRPELIPKPITKQKIEEEKKKIRDLYLRDQHSHKRFVIYSGLEFVDLNKFKINPHFQLQDYDLKYALMVSDWIIKASQAPQDNNFFGNITLLEEVLRIIRTRGKEKSFNDIIGLHTRIENVEGSYSTAKWKIENCFKTLSNYIEDCSKKLEPIYTNAVTQAAAHYKPEIAKEYISKLQKAAGIAAARNLWDNFLCSETNYKKKIQEIKKVIEGEPPKDFIERIISAYKVYDDAGLDKWFGSTEESLELLEQFIPKIIKQKPTEIVSTLNRLHHLWKYFDEPAEGLKKPIQEIFKLSGEDILVSFKNVKGEMVNFKIKETIGKAGSVVSFFGRYISLINTALALKDSIENPEFKTYLKTLKEASECANAFKAVRDQLMKHFGVTEQMLLKFAGSAIVVLAFIDAADHLKQGNNVALFGDMVIATGGTIQLLSRGGFYGWAAIVVIMAGTAIVFLSLDQDEKFLLNFENKYWSDAKYAADLKFLKTLSVDFNYIDDYLKVRGK